MVYARRSANFHRPSTDPSKEEQWLRHYYRPVIAAILFHHPALFLELEQTGPWYWIFSNHLGWGSFQFDAKQDVLRVPVSPQDAPFTEFLTYGFDERKPDSTVAFLQWEKKRIPLKIEVAKVNEIYVAKMRQELESWVGFRNEDWQTAAQFCADKDQSGGSVPLMTMVLTDNA